MAGRGVVMLLLAVQAITLLSSRPRTAAADWLGPVASPFFKGMCELVDCGKGRCRTDGGRLFGYVCECDPGWIKLITQNDRFQFLPCVIPNCTLNYECSNRTAAAPAPSQPPPLPPPSDNPFFDPCAWSHCGEGTCVKTASKFGHRCDCRPGYVNLLNSTTFPCVRECVLGADCAGLGIALPNATSPSSSSSDQVGRAANGAAATTSSPGRLLLWISLLMIALAISTPTRA